MPDPTPAFLSVFLAGVLVGLIVALALTRKQPEEKAVEPPDPSEFWKRGEKNPLDMD
jgi:hypothetical protein